jgi:nucleotide-binding universal stress UspA family protein
MFKTILVPVDVDDPGTWEGSIPVARTLAQSFAAKVTLCSILQNAQVVTEAQWSTVAYRQLIDVTESRLRLLAREVYGREIDVLVGEGSISAGIIALADTIAADLILLSSHRPGMPDHLFSAHAARVARHAKCSVLLVRGTGA